MPYQFQSSRELTLGIELELQIINPHTFNLSSRAKDLIRYIQSSPYIDRIKPEITQGMIELNSSIHAHANTAHTELASLYRYLNKISSKLHIAFCGGGTHPFQRWNVHKIFPTSRFRHLSKRYGYLTKRFTVFSMHLHIGCKNGDDAVYLAHMLSRYTPQFVTLSASSPFYQGIDTGYHSTRLNVVNAFPLSGHMPDVKTWEEFKAYYLKMRELKVIDSMKDFYWDVRPQAGFGTVELRVCDMPLSLQKAMLITAYYQTLSAYLLHERPHPITNDMYLVYDHNRFQACRNGYEGEFINPFNHKHISIHKDILDTIRLLEPVAKELGTQHALRKIKTLVKAKSNDAMDLRKSYKSEKSLEMIVKNNCALWRKGVV